MDMKAIFGDVNIGKDTSGNFRLSLNGTAVQVKDGKFVAYNGSQFIDVSELTFESSESFFYRIPVSGAKPGDLIVTSDDPFYVLFTQKVLDNGHISGIDPRTNEVKDYVPPTNLFKVQFLVKVVNLLDGLGDGVEGNSLLPLLLLSNGDGSSTSGDSLTTLLLVQSFGRHTMDTKTLLPLLLLRRQSEGGMSSDSLTTLLLLQSLGDGALDTKKLLPFLLLKGDGGDGLEMFLLMQAMAGDATNPLADLLGGSPDSPGNITGKSKQPKATRGLEQ